MWDTHFQHLQNKQSQLPETIFRKIVWGCFWIICKCFCQQRDRGAQTQFIPGVRRLTSRQVRSDNQIVQVNSRRWRPHCTLAAAMRCGVRASARLFGVASSLSHPALGSLARRSGAVDTSSSIDNVHLTLQSRTLPKMEAIPDGCTGPRRIPNTERLGQGVILRNFS